MKVLLIIFFIAYPLILQCQLSEKEIESKTVTFTNKLIRNADSLKIILQNESTIKTKLVLEYSEVTLDRYILIIKAQKQNNFFLSEFKIRQVSDNEKLCALIYRKHDNIFYNFYSLFFGNGCNNTVTYLYSIIDNKIYFRSISICQHMNPSGLGD